MGKADLNKQKKRESLLDTAFELFTTKGLPKTSIADIVERAGVAKGTFYLYFKDKYDIKDRLIVHKTGQLFVNAYAELKNSPEITDLSERIIFICDHVLDALSSNKPLVSLISKDLSWGVFKRVLTTSDDGADFKEIYDSMIKESGRGIRSPEMMLFLIVELVGATGYSAIMYNSPVTLDELKPDLYRSIRSIIDQFTE
ncbi:transcriptional regulator, TetR family [Lachnospiraceae bacterium XBB2008]|nr:transcriptional regulator, TetR family [Lachnospiraceae bacterium XBB2008]